ncbi:hypothetical protein BC941DRAFT_415980 [Chlamydoabsidia padenii]|nr:hypothetical protein BC941DRAFT_415980 [Chlamydoabsidia padenii]
MATHFIPDDLSYYIPINSHNSNKRRNIALEDQQQRKRRSSTTSSDPLIMTSKELAHAWLVVHKDPPTNSDLLTAMVGLKRRLLFSIDDFVNELNLTVIGSSPELCPLLLSYHTWSQHSHGMMPLISIVLPLLLCDNFSSTSLQDHTMTGHLVADCLRQLNNTKVSQDYLESIIDYQARTTSSNKGIIQYWLSTLFEQDRMGVANYLTSDTALPPLDLYLDYFDILEDKSRLGVLSLEERKSLALKEWSTWSTPLEEQKQGDIQAWLSLKSESLQSTGTTDLDIDLLMRKNVVWVSEMGNSSSSEMIDYLMGQYTKKKVPNMRLMYGIFGKYCHMLAEMGQDSTEIVKILESVRQLLVHHLQGSTDLIALLLSLVQIALHHMHSILTYADWFKSTFINTNTSIIKSKRQSNLWIKHLETMIPYETNAILQIHAKSLNDARHLQVSAYISSVKSKLLASGVDATLRHYPTHLGIPLISDSLHHDNEMNNSTIMGLQPADLNNLMNKYGETQNIPQSLWEDSIFRPKWFKQTFLPALMIDWKPSDSLTLERRAKMVIAFQQKGKIPASLMAQFQKT